MDLCEFFATFPPGGDIVSKSDESVLLKIWKGLEVKKWLPGVWDLWEGLGAYIA